METVKQELIDYLCKNEMVARWSLCGGLIIELYEFANLEKFVTNSPVKLRPENIAKERLENPMFYNKSNQIKLNKYYSL